MKVKRRVLVVDGQIFQTEARHRGMGRYSAYLLEAFLASQKIYETIEVILSNQLPIDQNEKAALMAVCKKANFHELDLATTTRQDIVSATGHNEAVVNRFVQQYATDADVDFLVLSLFQEPTVVVFPELVRRFLLFYDLIPYLYHHRYENVMPYDNYLRRFTHIFKADTVFTISQTVADDLRVYLGLPKKRIVNIDGAAIRASASVRPKLTLPETFILMPTSDDPRKNNLRAVSGFEEYRALTGASDCQLVITSSINTQERKKLLEVCGDIIFTGNLPEAELEWLYQNCQAVLFTPEYEGLGLPVLEAVEAGKPVVCSAINVFKEISQDAFEFCDYENPIAIAWALQRALKNPVQVSTYKKIHSHYSWTKTAERLEQGMQKTERRPDPKRRIAVFTPAPDGFSAIGKVVAESHAALSERFVVDYFIDPGSHQSGVRPNFLPYIAAAYPAQSFSVKDYERYEAVLYHVGNGDYHLWSIKNALYLPGYTIIHDTNISEAYRTLGETGIMSLERITLEQQLDNHHPSDSRGLTSLLDRQLGVLTHSEHAASVVKQKVSSQDLVKATNLPSAVASLQAPKTGESLVIGMAGIIADIKGISVIESIAKQPQFSNCLIKVFGFNYASPEVIERLNSYSNVMVAIALTDFEFYTNVSQMDIFVNYRLGYNGETSLSTIEAMRNGVAVLVKNIGWYSELPDKVAVKVTDADEVLEQLQKLVADKKRLQSIGQNAREYIDRNFTHEQYAMAIESLITASASHRGVNEQLAQRLRQDKIRTKQQYLKYLKAGV